MGKEPDLVRSENGYQNEATLLRNRLVDQLVERGYIRSKKIEAAFRKVPRHLFLPKIELQEAYTDGSIITKKIGIEPVSSSTSPSLMASMLELLRVKKGMRVLEIGTGTGYNAALLAELTQDERKIFSVDIDTETVSEAQQNLIQAGYNKITIQSADGAKGSPDHAPYDRIIVTCSVDNIPVALVEQLKEGGLIVLPIWFNGTQLTPALEKRQNGNLVGLQTTIGGFMKIRPETYQPGDETLLICSEHPELFDEKKLISFLLRGRPKEASLPLESIPSPRGGDFFIFLALHERKSVELFQEENFVDYGFGDSAAGVVDLEANSGCLISRGNRVLVYGDFSSYDRIVEQVKRWKKMERPGVQSLQVLACMKDEMFPLEKNDILFKEKSPLLVVKILERR